MTKEELKNQCERLVEVECLVGTRIVVLKMPYWRYWLLLMYVAGGHYPAERLGWN